jgi:hypothetical protein
VRFVPFFPFLSSEKKADKSGGAGVHISQVLQLQNVRALTLSMPDLQKALRVRESVVVEVRSFFLSSPLSSVRENDG